MNKERKKSIAYQNNLSSQEIEKLTNNYRKFEVVF